MSIIIHRIPGITGLSGPLEQPANQGFLVSLGLCRKANTKLTDIQEIPPSFQGGRGKKLFRNHIDHQGPQ